MLFLEGYCLEDTIDCSIMAISVLLITLDLLRLAIQVISSQNNRPKTIRRGKYLQFQFWLKMLTIFLLFGVSVGQILIWVLINNQTQSVLLVQMFSVNVICCCLWAWAIYQDKFVKGFTRPRTLANMSINLLSNIMVALLTSRNTLDNKDDFAFYFYAAFIGASGLAQIFFYQRSIDIVQPIANSSEDIHNVSTVPCQNNSIHDALISGNEQYQKNDILTDDTKDNQNNNDQKQDRLFQKNRKDQEEQKQRQDSGESLGVSDLSTRDNSKYTEKYSQQIMQISNVRIDKFVEMVKYSKKTIMFEIKFTSNLKSNTVKHSFREFISLKQAISQQFPQLELPPFPSKKPQNSVLTFTDLDERRKQLSQYLQELSKLIKPTDSQDMCAFFFLQCEEEKASISPLKQRPTFKKSNSDDTKTIFQNNTPIPETIWEEDEELTLSASCEDK